jgi:hypothetical protein
MLKPDSKVDLYVYTLAYLKNLNRIHPEFSYFFEYSIIWNFMYVLEVTSRLILISPVIRSTLVFYNVLKWLFEKKSTATNENFFFFLQLFFLNFFFNINKLLIFTLYLIKCCTNTKTPFVTYIQRISGARSNLLNETLNKIIYYNKINMFRKFLHHTSSLAETLFVKHMSVVGDKNIGTTFGLERTKNGKEHIVIEIAMSESDILKLACRSSDYRFNPTIKEGLPVAISTFQNEKGIQKVQFMQRCVIDPIHYSENITSVGESRLYSMNDGVCLWIMAQGIVDGPKIFVGNKEGNKSAYFKTFSRVFR